MIRILVIGGYGEFGGRLSRRLIDVGHEVIVGGRSAEKAARFAARLAGAQAAQVDRTADLRPLLARLQPDLVIDAAGPFQNSNYGVAEACIDTRTSYLDLADAREFVGGIHALDEAARAAGVVVISGASTLPGLSGAVIGDLADGLDRVDQVLIALSASTKSTANESVVRAILSYVGKPLPLWRGGRWDRAYGWQGLQKQTFSVGRARPLKRWVACADVPDLESAPGMLPGKPSVEFRAGTDEPLHMFALWLASWMVRLRLVDSLEPATAWLRRVQRATGFARGDRSAMQIALRGKRRLEGVERKWTLIAENFVGPEIPTMAAALLVDDVANDRVAPGARGASHALSLERFEELFAALEIKHEVTERPVFALYQRAMAERFANLPSAVRSMHEIYGDGGAAGEGSVATGSGPLAQFICWLMRFPPSGTYPVHVAFAERNGVEAWTRDFGGHCFRSRLSLSGGGLCERFGPLRFMFALPSDGGGLCMVLRGWRLFGVPMPRFLAPRIEAAEWEESGWFRFSVAVALPLVGPVIHYAGRLKRISGRRKDFGAEKRAAGIVPPALRVTLF